MKCPNCKHVSDTALLKCSTCGEAYDRDTLETFQHMEYLLDWLNERARILGPTAHARLRDETLRQLGDLRSALHLAPLLSPKEIAPKLALVEAALGQVPVWAKATGIPPAAAAKLRGYLSHQANDLKKQLAGRAVRVGPPSEVQVLDFGIESLPVWTKSLSLPLADAKSLYNHLTRERAALSQRTAHQLALIEATRQHLWDWVKTNRSGLNIADVLHKYLAGQANDLRKNLADTSVETEPPSDLQVFDFALKSLPQWSTKFRLSLSHTSSLRRYLEGKRAALLQPAPPAPPPPPPVKIKKLAPSTPAPRPKPAAPPAPRPKPIPKAPPKPKKPPIDWGKVWEKAVEAAVSGALLRGLLYLGAFMIVVASAILVILFWNNFPGIVKLTFMAAAPMAFYLLGWGARAKLELPEVGGVLTGIGALLVAVAFAAAYQQFFDMGVRLNGNAYWMVASIFCMIVYALTAWRLPSEFFDYITLIGGSSAMLAFTRLLSLPIEWSVASVTASSLLMIGVAASLGQATGHWKNMARASRYLPQILIPASLAVVIFVPGDAAFGQMAAFFLATLSYGLLAWRFPATIAAHATVWSSVGAVLFALIAVDLPIEWYASIAAVVGFFYILAGRWMGTQLDKGWKQRRGYLAAAYLVGFGMVSVAVLVGFGTLPSDLWAGVIALTLAAFVLAACAYLFRRPVLVLLAAGLFVAPFTFAVAQWLDDLAVAYWGAWLMSAWAGLALAYLGIAVILRAADEYGRWLNMWAHILALLVLFGLCGLIFTYGLTTISVPTLVALGGVIIVYIVSAVVHDSGRHPALSNWVTWLPNQIERAIFLWPVGLLAPVWLTVFWSAAEGDRPWLGVALAGLALAYVGLGQLLSQRKVEYRLPFHTYAYPLAVIGVLAAWSDTWAQLITLYIVVGVLAALASVYRRVLETAAAALLFIWPFDLSLGRTSLPSHAHSLAYALLVSLAYIPLGVWLDKQERKLSLPVYIVGYGLSAYALLTSLMGRLGAYRPDLPMVGVVVPLIVTGLQVFGAYRFRQPPFAWVGALTFAIAFGQTLTLLHIPPEYDATAWVGLAVAYMLAERVIALAKEKAWFLTFRWPLGMGTIALCTLGLLLTASGTVAAFTDRPVENFFPIILAQSLAVGLTMLAARLYYSRWPLHFEPWLVFFPVTLFFVGYGEVIFGQPLTLPQYGIVWSVLGWAHLLAGVLLDRAKVQYAHGPYLGGYALGAFAIVWAFALAMQETLPDYTMLLWTLGLGILAAVWSAILVHFNRHRTWDDLMADLFGQKQSTARSVARGAFLWLAAWSFPIWCVLLLRQLNVIGEFAWLGLSASALLFLGLAVWLRRAERTYSWPFHTSAQFYTALGLFISASLTARFLGGRYRLPDEELSALAFIMLQALAIIFYAASARVLRSRFFTYVTTALSFFPVTLFFITYGAAIFGQPLTFPQYGIVWSVLSLVHLLTGVLLDRAKVRYSHGPYLGGYALAVFAIVWTSALAVQEMVFDRGVLLWTLGLGILAAVWSAVLVHVNQHRTWDELMAAFFGKKQSTARSAVRGAFLWLAAWPFPIWCVLLLRQLNAVETITFADEFVWLGFGVPALLFLGLAVLLRRAERTSGAMRTYAWPFHTAAQFYTIVGLVISVPLTVYFFSGRSHLPPEAPRGLAVILLQALAVTFYAASAWALRRRFFAHVASWLSVFPYTLAWIVYDRAAFTQVSHPRFAWIWTGWAAVLLVIGFVLDRERKVRYAHGPYLVAYTLAGFALAWSARDRLVNVYTLAAAIGLALISQVLVHYKQHRSFDDLIGLFWRKPGTVARRAVRTVFLFFAAYAFPVWLTQLLTHNQVPLAWRGLALALSAPIYIAFGLAARRVKSEYTWPLYSAGYALTALGAMITYDDLALTIYVLALDVVVYAVSAYIFRQPFWLYLANVLVPAIALLTLHHNESLTAPWVSGTLMALAFVYFGIGRLFDWGRKGLVSRFALPFYAPGYILSAIALAAASTSDEYLAINIYSAGVVLYALSAWAFREAVFLYPAAWLAAVPYYLGMTLTSLEPRWYGLGWLPLIVAYIGLGRLGFQRKPLGIKNLRTFIAALTHPAMPFYLLAYGMSVSMMVLSQGDMRAFTMALAAGAAIYTVSAVLFRYPAWLYPGLLTAHLALATYFAIDPSGNPKYYITLPFLGMTWITALMGYALSLLFPVARRSRTGKWIFKLERYKLDFGNLPFLGHLVTPSWAQPLFIFAALDLVIWQTLALLSFETGIILAAGNALLLGLFAMLWLDTTLVYGALGLFLLGVGYRLGWASFPFADTFAWVGGIGFGLYFVALITEYTKKAAFTIWSKPLTNVAMFLTAVAVVATLPFVASYTTAFAFALAFAGSLYLAIAYRGHRHYLGYLGMAMLQLAWALMLIDQDVSQPQWYAIPAGLYFTGVGYLERRRKRGVFATIVESFGLAVLLVTSFIQSLDGAQGFPYFVLLLGEGLIVIGWGATQRLKMPFFIGLAASVLNVVAQIVVLVQVYDINRWFIVLGVGLMLLAVAAWGERKRGQIIARTQEWRDTLETWG
ncbi:MAG: hypothetical protein GY832_06405 [Chloroflexi bacterium]|nr:hypothetical protein [Chloroflexota bacterium]